MDSQDQGQRILITTWTLVGLSGAFLFVRLACKLHTKRYLWWDDYVLASSWVRPFLTALTLPLTTLDR